MSKENKEKKKIALKINVSKKSDTLKNQAPPKIITEWNYTRIVLALLLVIGLIIVGINFFRDKDKSITTEITTQNNNLEIVANKNTDPVFLPDNEYKIISTQSENHQNSASDPDPASDELVHAQLAKGIWNDRPFGNITESIKVNDEEATGIYYFTELENMKGKTVFHVWKFEDKIIFKKQKDIVEAHWKTHTSKLFTKRSVGFWSVETVDSNNRQLNVINFEVVAE